MTPGLRNGIYCVVTEANDDYRDAVRTGFYVSNAAAAFDELEKLFKTDTEGMTHDDKVKRLEGVKKEITDMGYETGPLESKTHREWYAEVIGVTDLLPEPPYEFDEEMPYNEFDEEYGYNEFDEEE
jgi:hypothetical protein